MQGGGRGVWEGRNALATKLRQREEELALLRANTSNYTGNILVQEAGQRDSGNVNDIFNATLMQAAGYKNKLNAERNRHSGKV